MFSQKKAFFRPKFSRCSEVALEQFWIQKSFCPAANIRLGHIIMPMGDTNQHHMPTEFFGVYRPEGENTILPCTWHETSISFLGRAQQMALRSNVAALVPPTVIFSSFYHYRLFLCAVHLFRRQFRVGRTSRLRITRRLYPRKYTFNNKLRLNNFTRRSYSNTTRIVCAAKDIFSNSASGKSGANKP